ncbi:uncharacterized protein RAG0_15115 [Rhynchosporium agropyri]|uniref:Uncharacterized protein n=1 Tax=Rhynchosporium agropyri TaxID=914238 RepID=A0A1E1LJP5_9HELO|nr:uncharacterized protein RAG0_15115 [Rhynchosporium agropyri]
MKYFSIVAAFTSMVAISSAAAVEKRADVSVYLCNDRNFTGYCKVIKSPSSVCVPLASDFDNLVSSVGPDPGVLCYFFVNANCNSNGGAFHYGNPGVADLSRTPVNGPAGSTRNYEDQISSYQCFTS